MTRLVRARCGMSAERAEFSAYPALRCAGYLDFQGEEAGFRAAPLRAILAAAAFEHAPDQEPIALALDTAGPVIMDSGPASAEPLALNLGVTDLFQLLRQDVLGLRATVDAMNSNFDPGDLTVPFNASL